MVDRQVLRPVTLWLHSACSTLLINQSRILILVLGLGLASSWLLPILRSTATVKQRIITSTVLPIVAILDIYRLLCYAWRRLSFRISGITVLTAGVDETQFPGHNYFEKVIKELETQGLRSTASPAHERFVNWIKDELSQIPDLSITSDEYDFLRWQTKNEQTLKQAGTLVLHKDSINTKIDIAGTIPYSKPTQGDTGELIYIRAGQALPLEAIKGKIVVRELLVKSVLMVLARMPSHSATSDLSFNYTGTYDRPSSWEIPMHEDLVTASRGGAAGVIFVTDLPRSQIDSYWDPHQGTHYGVPALFCGFEDVKALKSAASLKVSATMTIDAEVSTAKTANIIATLPGQIEETVIYATHTDGNTCVQDNGVASLLTLARYFASQPLSSRRRTLQFAFNTAHLHVSKEGSGVHAQALDFKYEEEGKLALVIPVEHLGPRELEAYPNPNGEGRILRYTGRGELMIWCVGPSPPLVAAVEDAVKRRMLDRVMVTRGLGIPRSSKVPTYQSFGGLGTLYNASLLPTTSIISGPWSLFAPSFGSGAVDIDRMRKQTLALGDIYMAVDNLTRAQIAGGYLKQREMRRRYGASVYDGFSYPPETLDETGRE